MLKKKFLIGKNKEEKEATWVDSPNGYYDVDGIPFNGHHVLWGFSYTPYTYLKESEISGEEYRKGGTIKFFRNSVQVYEDFCRETEGAAIRILELFNKLAYVDWEKVSSGTKIYWRNTPAKIDVIILEQGAFIVEVDGADRFPEAVWAKEDYEKMEDPRRVKIDVLDKDIWWYRK